MGYFVFNLGWLLVRVCLCMHVNESVNIKKILFPWQNHFTQLQT